MSFIKILPEILSNKIAAGEVVERPASVVKELVENAIDAQSSVISVEVENGGRSLIRVSDNGLGMAHDDALLSIERYATSKIYSDADLFSIRTLGFRGEALPSIAAVSQFTLISKDGPSSFGVEIHVQGGKILKVTETGAPRGTMITVKNLFFNTPARRKFLKTVNTEIGHISDTLARMALSNPHVRFKLSHNGKSVFDWPPSSEALHRVVDVLGKGLKNDLFALDHAHDDVRVSGWVAADRHNRSTNRGIHIYVNRRFVRDQTISHALFEGLSGRLMKGSYPTAVIFVALPSERVDVNVHPTKHEVRFADAKTVHACVRTAILRAFTPSSANPRDLPGPTVFTVKDSKAGTLSEVKSALLMPAAVSPENKMRPSGLKEVVSPAGEIKEQAGLWEKRFFSDLRIVGQLHNTYIVCESKEDLILIDQHAAHERIMYENLRRASVGQPIPRQRLLMPEIIEAGFGEAEILRQLAPELTGLGWEMEPFGGNTFAIKAVPGVLAGSEVAPVMREIMDKAVELGFATGMENTLEESRKIMACHGAIRASRSLTDTHMTRLLEQLDQCENPSNCPHGRPTWIQITKNDLEKQFKRVV